MKKSGIRNRPVTLKMIFLLMLSLMGQLAGSGQTRKIVSTIYDDGVYTCDIHILYDQVNFKPEKGVYYYWYRNGHIHFNSGNYSGNLLHGEFEKFSYPGSLKEKGHFKLGTKDGRWLFWTSRGEIFKEELWKRGFLKSRTILQNDTIISEFFRDNVLRRKIVSEAANRVISKEKFRNGKLTPVSGFSLSGVLKKVFTKRKQAGESLPDESCPRKRQLRERRNQACLKNAEQGPLARSTKGDIPNDEKITACAGMGEEGFCQRQP